MLHILTFITHYCSLPLPTLFHPPHHLALTPQLSALLPALTPEGRKAALNDLTKWAKGLTLARRCEECTLKAQGKCLHGLSSHPFRPLVKTSVRLIPEEGVLQLQMAMPPTGTADSKV